MAPPARRTKLLSDVSDADSSSEEGVQPAIRTANGTTSGFKINEEYAKRFEHNKKREEQHSLEDKYKGESGNQKRPRDADGDEDDDEESTDESEDDDAELVTEMLDAEILDTLQAIKRKDPRVYDKTVKFYQEFDVEGGGQDVAEMKKEKPMYLRDYHRENLMAGRAGIVEEDDADAPMQTYQDEQDQLKRELVGSMHTGVGDKRGYEDRSDEDDGFLVAKPKPKHDDLKATSRPKAVKITNADVAAADKDPETFLSNFMAARAWLPSDGHQFHPLNSDDSEEDERAEEFETAYNLRFEDPQMANEKLQSFARDVGKYSVRREENKSRKRARDQEREQKGAAKREREEEKARLRKLRIEDAEEKIKMIQEASGLGRESLDIQQWRDIIEGDFDDDEWEREMRNRFGDKYHEADGDGEISGEEGNAGAKKRKYKKPKWQDDIEINDLVPEFDEEKSKPKIKLSSDEEGGQDTGGAALDEDASDQAGPKRKSTKKTRVDAKREARRAARKQRLAIEEIVDATLPISYASAKSAPGFRYRDTSPTSFGLSARDILFANDAQLNQFAGLKRMAAFRDPSKKAKDKKRLSKKARLKEWRKETFGQADEVKGGFERILGGQDGEVRKLGADDVKATNGDEAGKKKRRSRKKTQNSGETKVDV